MRKLFVMINYVIQMVFYIFILGKCTPKDNWVECNCKPGWSGMYCEIKSCRKWDGCGKDSNCNLMKKFAKCEMMKEFVLWVLIMNSSLQNLK